MSPIYLTAFHYHPFYSPINGSDSNRPWSICLLFRNTAGDADNSMNEWCINQHGKTGLTQACIDSPHTHEQVEEKVRAYLEKWIPETGAGLLAGSSVHADMR